MENKDREVLLKIMKHAEHAVYRSYEKGTTPRGVVPFFVELVRCTDPICYTVA